MISKAKLKYIQSLHTKKGRVEHGAFIAEGRKVVNDLLATFRPILLLATADWIAQKENKKLYSFIQSKHAEVIAVTAAELKKASCLQHPQNVLCVFQQKSMCKPIDVNNQLVLALDGVQDPGNVGTIIRIADWFGITTIVCSKDTAEVYNPKVIQATMGSIAHVQVIYTQLSAFIDSLPLHTPIYGTVLNGKDIYSEQIGSTGLIIMGNEGNGISDVIKTKINKPLYIPNFSTNTEKAESLNVAIATAIVCSEFRRR